MDALGGALSPELKGVLRGEGLSEDHHGIHMGVLHCLEQEQQLLNNIPLLQQKNSRHSAFQPQTFEFTFEKISAAVIPSCPQ